MSSIAGEGFQAHGKCTMSTRLTVLGAGFGGMELSTLLSESLGDEVRTYSRVCAIAACAALLPAQ